MKISDNGLDLIKRWEALRLEAYLPTPDDVWTIGYGHTLGVGQGLTCTPEQAEAWLREDVSGAEHAINVEMDCPLEQQQYDALVSFVFNIGISAFNQSTLLVRVKEGNLDDVPKQMMRWKYQHGKIVQGLINRRRAEVALWSNRSNT